MSLTDEPLLSEDQLEATFSENALTVLRRRYLRKNEQGQPGEDITGMFRRIARHIAAGEGDATAQAEAEELFYRLLTRLRFVPNSPTFTGAGTPLGQLAACFVLPIEDDMGKHTGGIFQTLRDAALIQQTGGGNGFSFSRLRPRNALVRSSMGQATGPVGFLRVYDRAFGEIAQGGQRRGANMAVLRVDHPDIEVFISCKTSEDAITNFNISVGALDGFMEAVARDDDWQLRFPDVEAPQYRNSNGALEQLEAAGIPALTHKHIKARALFQQIARQAWRNGEPGMLFLDAAQRDNPVPHIGSYECTNPCGEQFLLPYENCCLGSINLERHLTTTAAGPGIDWERLAETTHIAVRFLDDVVSVNAYVPAVPQLREAAQRSRRIGLGIMGLADVLYHLGVAYGSVEGQQLAAQIMEFVRYHAMQTSITLAEVRGPFPAIQGSVYDPQQLAWQPPHWPAWLDAGPTAQWGRPALDWDAISAGIHAHGIRNAAQLTVAPTGTIATVAGIEGYGCEPAFALAYTRHVQESDRKIALRYLSPTFVEALEKAGLPEATRERICQQVLATGSCQHIAEAPEAIRKVFVVAADVPAEGHIRMQAALQAFTDASISKTINLPANATPADVEAAFMLAWQLGCKGLTVYVAGSREKEVLETEATRQQKHGEATLPAAPAAPKPTKPWEGPGIRPRPQCLSGHTYRIPTPVGSAFVTLNSDDDDQPFEAFLNVAKAGSETAAMAEAIGRLISLLLRLPSPLAPLHRLEEIVAQLTGIGGGRPLGFGHDRVLSLPDGVARALNIYLQEGDTEAEAVPAAPPAHHTARTPIGDLCPACGQAAMVYTEGCRRCYTCGHSEC